MKRIFYRKNSGFTFIELSMVILVLSIALLIVAVNLDSIIPSERLRAQAKKIGSLIQLARAEAAFKGVNYGIVYDLRENAFWLLVPEIEGQETENYDAEDLENSEPEIRKKFFYHKLEEPVEFIDVQVGEKNAITDKIVRIEVTPLGLASGHIVHLKDTKNDNEFSIELNSLTALVSYYNKYKEFTEVIDYEE